jgi:hypothetical protein
MKNRSRAEMQKEMEERMLRDKKLEAVSFLRQNAQDNNMRLYEVKNILYHDDGRQGRAFRKELEEQEFGRNKIRGSETAQKAASGSESDSKTAISSFLFRSALCACLLAAVHFMPENIGGAFPAQKENLLSVVQTDYTENLFDFIEQIPYTLEYEKINVE